MFGHATSSPRPRTALGLDAGLEAGLRVPHSARRDARTGTSGSALAATLVVFTAVAGLALAASQLSFVEAAAARRSIDDVRATAAAEAGVERVKAMLTNAARKTAVKDPLDGVRAIFDGGTSASMPFYAESILQDGVNVGEFTTSMTLRRDTAREIVVTLSSTGYIPRAPQNLGPLERLQASESIEVTLRYSVGASEAFDSAYFVNNWGWLRNDSLQVNGNVRCNGPLSVGGGRPTIAGQPLFDSVSYAASGATLGDRRGEQGLFSAWGIEGADNVESGNGGSPDKHPFQSQVAMPNLTDLSRYEALAAESASSVMIGRTVVCDGVTGNSAGESMNLYLHGTAEEPIVLNGPVVVRGDVMISGYVTGQCAVYSVGNVYVPDSVRYLSAPSSPRPATNSRADIEAWLGENRAADFLGLFARENVIVGDFTDADYAHAVDEWLSSPLNPSHEDAGLDQIAGTRHGRDGVPGTADDDVLEGDGAFSVEHYSAEDQARGLIPEGYDVGDAIPGSGEDIDGDGEFDDSLSTADFAFEDELTDAHWDGNMPAAGISDYADIASLCATRLDATFYTNHAFAWVVFGSDDAELNGALVARNESAVYATPRMRLNYDARLLLGGVELAGDMLPETLQPAEVLQWRRLAKDPHPTTMP